MRATEISCQRCEAPLPTDSPGGICPACLMGAAVGDLESLPETVRTELDKSSGAHSPVPDSLEGTTLGIGGRYKILQRIGEGGFGTVYMAEQSIPVRRRVALKILKAGLDTRQMLARFESERQALAMMDHPSIAKVLDGGETEQGRPFFAMELVRGTPITEFCDRESLNTKARLEIFLQVCRAVQHAHQKGIIHRDLKPANVLITMPDGAEPVPKVIDFGVAKAMETNLTDKTLFTRFEQMIGTPAYMSPEQAGLEGGQDVDTRADIYALGVLLYELLIGTTPFEADTLQKAAYEEVRRILREVDAPRPSTRYAGLAENRRTTLAKSRATESSSLSKRLRGDLDWIVMKAIEKDRRRRYETANALACDVERHLANEPVTAGPPTVRYRVSKFLQRNKTGVGIAAVVLLSLVGGLALAMVGFARAKDEASKAQSAESLARRAEDRAGEEAKTAHAINKFLVDDILGQAGLNEALENNPTIKTALDRAAERVDARLGEQPLVLAEIRGVLADAYQRMGFYGDAEEQAREASRLLTAEKGEDSQPALAAQTRVATALSHLQKYEECLETVEPVLERQRKLLGRRHPETLESTRIYLSASASMGKAKENVALARSFVADAEVVYAQMPEKLLEARHALFRVLRSIGSTYRAEVEEGLVNTIEEAVQQFGADHPLTIGIKLELGDFYSDSGNHPSAARLYSEAIDALEASGGRDSLRLIWVYNSLAVVLDRQGKRHAAEPIIEKAFELSKAHAGDRASGESAIIANNMAVLLRARGKSKEAVELLEEAYQRVVQNSVGEYHSNSRNMFNTLASSYMDLGNYPAAEEVLRGPVEALVRKDGLEAAAADALFASLVEACLAHRQAAGLRSLVTNLAAQAEPNPGPQIVDEILEEIRQRIALRAANRAGGSGKWEAAKIHFESALKAGGGVAGDYVYMLRIGAVLLKLGEYETCREVCEAYMDEHEATLRAEPAAKIFLLTPCPVDDPLLKRSLKIVREMTAEFKEEETYVYHWYALTRGMGEYRAGNIEEALPWLEKAKKGWADCRATAAAFHALAAHRLGDAEAAARELERAELYARRRAFSVDHGATWFDVLIADIALEEARQEIVLTGTVLVSPGGEWSYLATANGVDPATHDPDFHQTFADLAFDDHAWAKGNDSPGLRGGFGYGDEVGVTWDTPERGNRKTAYLRHRFTVAEPHTNLILRARIDDGVIVYLDGKDVGRYNMRLKESESFDLRAKSARSNLEENLFRVVPLEGDLVPGEHVLGVSLHNVTPVSSDLRVGEISLYATPVGSDKPERNSASP